MKKNKSTISAPSAEPFDLAIVTGGMPPAPRPSQPSSSGWQARGETGKFKEEFQGTGKTEGARYDTTNSWPGMNITPRYTTEGQGNQGVFQGGRRQP
jgi:hypothetical protein